MLPSVQFKYIALPQFCQAFCAFIFDCDRIHNVCRAVRLFRTVESRAGGRQQIGQIVRGDRAGRIGFFEVGPQVLVVHEREVEDHPALAALGAGFEGAQEGFGASNAW